MVIGGKLTRNLHEMGVLKLVCDPSGKLAKGSRVRYLLEVEESFEHVLTNPSVKAIVLATPPKPISPSS